MQKLVKRMTRFLVDLDYKAAISNLGLFLDDLGYIWKINTPSLVIYFYYSYLIIS